jgi:deoxyribonuclease-4
MRIGAHVSIAGAITNAPGNAAAIGCECFQIFTRSPRGGPAKDIPPETGERFRDLCKSHNQGACYIHTPYYINLASSDRTIAGASVRVVREELERGCVIGADAVMTHLGSSGSSDRDAALRRVLRNTRKILKGYGGSTQLLLEVAAGSGSIVGSTFEELAFVAHGAGDNCGVCLDTQHMFASGYDIRTKKSVAETIDRFDAVVGLERLRLIHANDSKVPFNSRRDRHEHIGEGEIGRPGFAALISEDRLAHIDLVLETRHDRVEEDILILKSLRG